MLILQLVEIKVTEKEINETLLNKTEKTEDEIPTEEKDEYVVSHYDQRTGEPIYRKKGWAQTAQESGFHTPDQWAHYNPRQGEYLMHPGRRYRDLDPGARRRTSGIAYNPEDTRLTSYKMKGPGVFGHLFGDRGPRKVKMKFENYGKPGWRTEEDEKIDVNTDPRLYKEKDDTTVDPDGNVQKETVTKYPLGEDDDGDNIPNSIDADSIVDEEETIYGPEEGPEEEPKGFLAKEKRKTRKG